MKQAQRWARVLACVWLLGGGACAPLIGIEDVRQDTTDGGDAPDAGPATQRDSNASESSDGAPTIDVSSPSDQRTTSEVSSSDGAPTIDVSSQGDGAFTLDATQRDGAPTIDAAGPCAQGQTAPCREDSAGSPIAGWNDALDGNGICRLGSKACGISGTWGACTGAVGPKPRDCESPNDNNCDNLPDNTIDTTCQCNAAHPTAACTGANNCPGTRACGADHQLAITCDAPASCDCIANETASCTGGPSNCAGGTKTCGADRKWGTCMGAPAHCDCTAGQTRPCSALDGAWPCGQAPCLAGQWDGTACTPATQWCQDLDGDGACSSVCVTQCTGPANTKKNCPPTDCNDSSAAINPTSPESCTSGTSCVTQSLVYSATSGKCECKSGVAPANEGATCAAYSTCVGGACTCSADSACSVGCQTGYVSCILGAACKLTGSAPAGTSCGPASVCNGANACYTNCTLGNPKCVVASCVSGSVTMNCTEGAVCNATYAAVGTICEGTGQCDATHVCVH